jgi:hypothetical protein
MSQYSTLLAHSRRLGVKAVISEGMKFILNQHFANISIPTTSMDCSWKWKELWLNDVNQLTVADLEDKNIMIYKYVFDLNAFNFYWHELIAEEFVFYPDVESDARNYLRNISEERKSSMTEVFFVMRRAPKSLAVLHFFVRNGSTFWYTTCTNYVAGK